MFERTSRYSPPRIQKTTLKPETFPCHTDLRVKYRDLLRSLQDEGLVECHIATLRSLEPPALDSGLGAAFKTAADGGSRRDAGRTPGAADGDHERKPAARARVRFKYAFKAELNRARVLLDRAGDTIGVELATADHLAAVFN